MPDVIEEELVRRIAVLQRQRSDSRASMRSKLKFGAALRELSDFLGWLRVAT